MLVAKIAGFAQRKRYRMWDDSDLEILYSADVLDIDILITSDGTFFDANGPLRDICARIMRPLEHLMGRWRRRKPQCAMVCRRLDRPESLGMAEWGYARSVRKTTVWRG